MCRQVYLKHLICLSKQLKITSISQAYCCLEELILKALRKEDYSEELKEVQEVHGTDTNPLNLQSELDILNNNKVLSRLVIMVKVLQHILSFRLATTMQCI